MRTISCILLLSFILPVGVWIKEQDTIKEGPNYLDYDRQQLNRLVKKINRRRKAEMYDKSIILGDAKITGNDILSDNEWRG